MGPAWLGIGAQRSGTTWLTDLLCSHPMVRAGSNGRKEQHRLYRGLFVSWDEDQSRRYRRLFVDDDPAVKVGECTPYYLRAPWAPDAALHAVDDDAPIWVILRDPVDRFESAMRYWLTFNERHDVGSIGPKWIRTRSDRALWGGMYATQLELWASVVGADRLMVLQYERVREDPQRYVDRLWEAMGVSPMRLPAVDRPSRTTSQHPWSIDDVPDLRMWLRAAYSSEVERLEGWGIDLSLWPNFVQLGARSPATRVTEAQDRNGSTENVSST